jgi:hypothetical protein
MKGNNCVKQLVGLLHQPTTVILVLFNSLLGLGEIEDSEVSISNSPEQRLKAIEL